MLDRHGVELATLRPLQQTSLTSKPSTQGSRDKIALAPAALLSFVAFLYGLHAVHSRRPIRLRV